MWIWSATSPGYREIEVQEGATTHCAVRQAIAVEARAFERRGKHRVAPAFQAEKRLDHTIYRAGKRSAVRWQCLDAGGGVPAEGAMRYG